MGHTTIPDGGDDATRRALARIWAKPPPAPRRIDWWVWCVPLLGLLQVVILVALEARLGRIGVVLWSVAPPLMILLVASLLVAALLSSIRRRDALTRWRVAGYLGLAAVAATVPLYDTYPSSYDDKPSPVEFRLPLDGPVRVAWGGETIRRNYHATMSDQRWAYDLLVTHGDVSHTGDGSRLDQYFCYDALVRAPAAGSVRVVVDGEPDRLPDEPIRGRRAAGNHVILDVQPGEFLVVAHLRPGSIVVHPGQRVAAGEPLGRVGNSGNSSEPHVHLHLQDTVELGVGEGIPFFFAGYERDGALVERGMPAGGIVGGRFVGEVVRQGGNLR